MERPYSGLPCRKTAVMIKDILTIRRFQYFLLTIPYSLIRDFEGKGFGDQTPTVFFHKVLERGISLQAELQKFLGW